MQPKSPMQPKYGMQPKSRMQPKSEHATKIWRCNQNLDMQYFRIKAQGNIKNYLNR